MILNQPNFFARSATLDGAISDTDTQITLAGLSTRFTDAVAAGTVRYPIGPFRISDDDGFELIAITGHVSGSTFEVERGIQGTTAEAWADGTAVRAVVTRRQLVDSESVFGIVDPQAEAFDTFRRSDRDLNGDTLPSGQTYEVVNDLHGSGSYEIVDNLLRPTTNDAQIDSPILLLHDIEPAELFYMRILCYVRRVSNRGVGLVLGYQDINNMIYFLYDDQLSMVRRIEDGVVTTLTSNSGQENRGYVGPIGVVSLGSMIHFVPEGRLRLRYDTTDDERSIIANSTKRGLIILHDEGLIKNYTYANYRR